MYAVVIVQWFYCEINNLDVQEHTKKTEMEFFLHQAVLCLGALFTYFLYRIIKEKVQRRRQEKFAQTTAPFISAQIWGGLQFIKTCKVFSGIPHYVVDALIKTIERDLHLRNCTCIFRRKSVFEHHSQVLH